MTDKEKLTNAVMQLSNIVNPVGRNEEELAQAVVDEFFRHHRTLQQNMIRFLSITLRKIDDVYNQGLWTDLRNEHAASWVSQVVKIDNHFPFC